MSQVVYEDAATAWESWCSAMVGDAIEEEGQSARHVGSQEQKLLTAMLTAVPCTARAFRQMLVPFAEMNQRKVSREGRQTSKVWFRK